MSQALFDCAGQIADHAFRQQRLAYIAVSNMMPLLAAACTHDSIKFCFVHYSIVTTSVSWRKLHPTASITCFLRKKQTSCVCAYAQSLHMKRFHLHVVSLFDMAVAAGLE